MEQSPDLDFDSGTLIADPGPEVPHPDEPSTDEPTRIGIAFEPSGKTVRVPLGVTVFDVASWNAIAVDSTCGGHGSNPVSINRSAPPIWRRPPASAAADYRSSASSA